MSSRSFVLLLVLACSAAASADDGPSVPTPRSRRGDRALARLVPTFFEANRGQAPEGWDFVVRCRGYHAFVRSGEVTFSLDGRALSLRLGDAQPAPPDVAGLELTGRANYLIGNNREKWVRGIPLSRGAVYRDAAPGTTWTVGSKDHLLDFALDVPGSEEPRFRLTGADAVRIGEGGMLFASMPTGDATFTAPVAWQMDGRVRRAVEAKYVLDGNGLVRIALGRRDAARPTIVDPTVSWISYLGAKAEDSRVHAATTSSGTIRLAGETFSTDFPVTSGAYSTTKKNDASEFVRTDAFVVELASSGTSLAWATYFGGSGDETPVGMAVDASGNTVIGGHSASSDLPTTSGVVSTSQGGSSSGGFVTKLDAEGDGLVWSTYVSSFSMGCTLGPKGHPYLLSGADLVKLEKDATAVLWSKHLVPTVFIGNQTSSLFDVAVDRFDEACVVGASSQSNLALTAGTFQTKLAGSMDAVVFKLDSDGKVVWTTAIGGSKQDTAFAVGVDYLCRPTLVGFSQSTDFPVSSDAYQASLRNTGPDPQDGFLARLSADGKSLVYATYCGGKARDEFVGVAVHPTGAVYVVGNTDSSDFPLVSPFQNSIAGQLDSVFQKWDHHLGLSWSSYIGGSLDDAPTSVAAGPDGSATLVGDTVSNDLGVTSALQSSFGGAKDSFFVTVPDSLPTSISEPSIASTALPESTVDIAYSQDASVSGGEGPFTWTLASGSLPSGVAFSADGKLSGTPTETGIFMFVLRVQDDFDLAAEAELSLRINPAPVIETASLPDWTVGVPFDETTKLASGTGTSPFTWTLTEGTLPKGLDFGTDGRLAGTPTEAGTRSFTVQVQDAAGATVTRSYSLAVNPTPTIAAGAPPTWTERRPLEFQFSASGGTGSRRWSVASGTLPVQSDLAAESGLMRGTARGAGTYEFVLRVTDDRGAIAEQTYQTVLNPKPAVTTTQLPPAALGRAYSSTVAVADGTPPFAWVVSEGALPAGLHLDTDTGALHGTPTAESMGWVELTCIDRAGAEASGQVLIRSAAAAALTKRKASGSLRVKSGGVTGTSRFAELTAGCLLDVIVSGGGSGGVGPTLRLLSPDGTPVDLGTRLRTTPRGATLKRFAVPATGRWFVAVDAAPDFEGTLRFTISIAPPKKWTTTLSVDAAAPSPAEARFAAPPGTKLTITVAPVAKGSARPVLADVLGPDSASLLAGGKTGGKGSTVTFSTRTPLVGGDHRVLVTAVEGFSGDVVCTVKLKLPRTYTFTLPELLAGDDE